MAIFARRTIQRLLNENASFMRIGQAMAHARLLNQANDQSLDFEWEVVVLNAFSKVGTVQYEPDLGGTSKPDILFAESPDGPAAFIAEIATVSNRGRAELNPIEFFSAELIRRAHKARLSANKFALRVGGALEGQGRGKVVKLKLPPKGELARVFDGEFDRFLRLCQDAPVEGHRFERKCDGIEVEIGYNPAQDYMSTSYMSFDVAYSPTRNPVHHALSRKADQLRNAHSGTPKGIVLCAADCDLDKGFSGASGFGVDRIVQHFLRDNLSIAFVLVLAALEGWQPWYRKRDEPRTRIYSKLYLNQKCRMVPPERLIEVLRRVHEKIPVPVANGLNALHHLRSRRRQVGRSFSGGYGVTGDSVRISARALLELLAGRLDQKAFLERHSLPGGAKIFDVKLQRGMTIDAVNIEQHADEDDDWITFHFRSRDPAISAYSAQHREPPSDK